MGSCKEIHVKYQRKKEEKIRGLMIIMTIILMMILVKVIVDYNSNSKFNK